MLLQKRAAFLIGWQPDQQPEALYWRYCSFRTT